MTTTTVNAYWDAIRDHTQPSPYTWDGGALTIGQPTDHPEWWKIAGQRTDYASRYSWTITDPDTVAFVTEHAGPCLIDPMAGTGWWAHLLTAAGVAVTAYDPHPPGRPNNHWHRDTHQWHPITVADGVDAVTAHGTGRTLLLSWPPYDEPVGANILAAYPGDRVIYIGEGPGGCCGDDRMFGLLDTHWTEVAAHRPVQWYGIHDHVTVYDRKR